MHLITVLMMATTLCVSGDDEIDPFIVTLESLNNNYFSSAASAVAESLGEFMANMLEELEDILEEVKLRSVTESLQSYKEALNLAQAATCNVDVANDFEDAQDTMGEAANICANTVSVDDLVSVIQEIKNIEKQIISLDLKLKKTQNEQTKVINELRNAFSSEVVAKMKQLEVADIKQTLDKCIKDTTESLWTQLDSCTKKTKE